MANIFSLFEYDHDAPTLPVASTDMAPTAAPGPSATLTHIKLTCTNTDAKLGVPLELLTRSIAQLQTLEHVELHLNVGMLTVQPEDVLETLVHTVKALPHVRRIGLEVEQIADRSEANRRGGTRGLLRAVADFDRLEELALRGCLVCCWQGTGPERAVGEQVGLFAAFCSFSCSMHVFCCTSKLEQQRSWRAYTYCHCICVWKWYAVEL